MDEPSSEPPDSALEKYLSDVVDHAILHNLEVDHVALTIHAATCTHSPCPHTIQDLDPQDRERAKAAIRELRRWTPPRPDRGAGPAPQPPGV